MRRLGTLLATFIFACGPGLPKHDGYESRRYQPWKDFKKLDLDTLNEAETDDTVSYPRRKRARWYAVDLPASGEMEVRLTYEPLFLGQESEDLDLAFEVLDADHRVVLRADAGEPDAGEDKKSRTLYELRPGRYYVHVYCQKRLDEAQFTLRLAFKPSDGGTILTSDVAYVDNLPAVPPVDDAPPPRRARPRRNPEAKREAKEAKPKKRETQDGEETPSRVRARISGISAVGGGTRIRINRGKNGGVEAGWRGSVVNESGRPIPGGTFEVSKVSAAESYAEVKATVDAVTSAKYVLLHPP